MKKGLPSRIMHAKHVLVPRSIPSTFACVAVSLIIVKLVVPDVARHSSSHLGKRYVLVHDNVGLPEPLVLPFVAKSHNVGNAPGIRLCAVISTFTWRYHVSSNAIG